MSVLFAHRLSTRESDFAQAFQTLVEQRAPTAQTSHTVEVAEILEAVRQRGDAAVLEYTREHDGVEADSMTALQWETGDFAEAFETLEPSLRTALMEAAQRIREFAERQLLEPFEYEDRYGSHLGQRIEALQRVGVYVPGGTAAYPSSVLMNAIPARVAGVMQVYMMSPTPGGQTNATVLAAAHVAGIDQGWAVGGAQAIAALAWGTASVPAVDKIVGPGNAWVAEAKRQVFGRVGIDMVAGPSEIVIVSDASAEATWLAADLLAQAEHDPQAQAILLSPDSEHLEAVAEAVAAQLDTAPREAIIRQSLKNQGALIQTEDVAQAMELVVQLAPEHLHLALADPDTALAQVRHAGAIFLGAHSPEVMGDYCAGPNHVLPTMRTARFASPLGAYDFQKRSTTTRLSPEGAVELSKLAEVLAKAEGLHAHAASARFRQVGGETK